VFIPHELGALLRWKAEMQVGEILLLLMLRSLGEEVIESIYGNVTPKPPAQVLCTNKNVF
jgi:hypothetical protein